MTFSVGNVVHGESGMYVLTKHIGTGRFGVVFSCRPQDIDTVKTEYVIKFPRHFRDAHRSISSECAILRRCSTLETVVQFVDRVKNEERMIKKRNRELYYPIIERMDMDMYKYIRNLRKYYKYISMPIVVDISRQLITGIQEIHRMGFLHADIKPENILVNQHGDILQIKYCDVGSFMRLTDYDTCKRSPLTTPSYRALECVLDLKPFTPKTDVWSLGCTLFEIATGRTLFDFYHSRESLSDYEDEHVSDSHTTESDTAISESQLNTLDAASAGACTRCGDVGSITSTDSETCWDTPSNSDESDSDEEYMDDVIHLEQMISLLGKIPRRLAIQNRDFFNNKSELRNPYTHGLRPQTGPVPQSMVLYFNENRDIQMETPEHAHMITLFCDMLSNMLWYSVHRRMSPAELLQHRLFQ
jgi:serine/threonine protein kinase